MVGIRLDQFSVPSLYIEPHFEEQRLGSGTAFVWHHEGRAFLTTNWHNVTGRDFFQRKHIRGDAAEPNWLKVFFRAKQAQPGRVKFEHAVYRVRLYGESQTPQWYIHPESGQSVDVIALPLPDYENVELFALNTLPTVQLAVRVGMDAFIIGFPLGLEEAGVGFPVWKRASIASEPELFGKDRRYVLYDTASRPGMSGSPIVRREWNQWNMENGMVRIGEGIGTRVIGIYSGRLVTPNPLDVQLGIGWPIHLVEGPPLVGSSCQDQLRRCAAATIWNIRSGQSAYVLDPGVPRGT
jgi:hypothetical protein